MIKHTIYNENTFTLYCESCGEPSVHECALSFSLILLESIDRDFDAFLLRFAPYITYHQDNIYHFAIPLDSDYSLFISVHDSKVYAIQIEERYLDMCKTENPDEW